MPGAEGFFIIENRYCYLEFAAGRFIRPWLCSRAALKFRWSAKETADQKSWKDTPKKVLKFDFFIKSLPPPCKNDNE
jgi:hypothetical protein